MKSTTAFYKRVVVFSCPYCEYVKEIENIDPIATIDIVSIGKVLTCVSCNKKFKIASEEVL